MKKTMGARVLSLLLSCVLLGTMLPAAVASADPADPTYSITVAPPSIDLVEGDEGELTAKVVSESTDGTKTELDDAGLAAAGLSIRWESKDKGRVSVESPNTLTTKVMAVKTGETTDEKKVTITAYLNSGTGDIGNASCEITVKPAVTPGISIDPPAVTEIDIGQTLQLTAKVTPEGAPLTWRSESPSVATVNSATGEVKGVATGKAGITAISGSNTAPCEITVKGILLDETSLTMNERDTHTLKANPYGSLGTLKWTSSRPEIVTVTGDGYLYAKAQGDAVITVSDASGNYQAACSVTVKRNTADIIFGSAGAGEPLAFSSLRSKLQNQCSSVLGSSLRYISGLTVDTRQGTLYYQYKSEGDTGKGVGTGEQYYADPSLGQMSLSELYFVPKPDFSGTAVIHYTGYASGSSFFQGTIEVTVEEQEDVSYSVAGQQPLSLNADDFNRICRSHTGRELSYVIFSQPDSGRGTLYYNYISEQNYGSKVDTSKQYKRSGSPNLSDITFVAAAGYRGEVVIPYTGYDSNGSSFRGRITIRVSQAQNTGDLTYTIAQGGKVTFDDDDFNDLSKAVTGYPLDYVQFERPDSSKGALYYDYSSNGSYDSQVTEGRSYYRSSSPYLRRVTFVAGKDYSGTVHIPFTGWDTKGNRFSGTVAVEVGRTGDGDVRYSTYRNGRITFDDGDFNTLCRELTGTTLNYVRFELPDASEGTLYYNYRNGSYDSKVSESRNYYRSSSPYVDRITFVPKKDFSGTVDIPFTGWSSAGEKFYGTVIIGVDSGDTTIRYQTKYGKPAAFADGDFDDLSELLTGEHLNYVRFQLPDSGEGTLYYDYDDGKYASKVSASRNYYRSSSAYLDRVSFVPDENFYGTVKIGFTGWNTKGERFEGTIEITVEEPAGASEIVYTTLGTALPFRSQDFRTACAARGEGELREVRFTSLPSGSAGRLYYNYRDISEKGTEVRTGTQYTPDGSPNLSDLTFLPKAGFTGSVQIGYEGTDSRGKTFRGQIRIQVNQGSGSRYFQDMGSYAWAAPYVDLLYEAGVITGTGGQRYRPADAVSRGDFMLMLYRAFQLTPASGAGFPDVPPGSYYAQAIQAARAAGIASGYPDGGFHPQEPVTRQDAMVLLERTMQATGWSLGAANTGYLSGFRDGGMVAPYAQEAMSHMIEYGIITGTPEQKLNPIQSISRAEMAVMLARAITF